MCETGSLEASPGMGEGCYHPVSATRVIVQGVSIIPHRAGDVLLCGSNDPNLQVDGVTCGAGGAISGRHKVGSPTDGPGCVAGQSARMAGPFRQNQ